MLNPLLGLPYPEEGDRTFRAYLRALAQSPTLFWQGLLTVWLCLVLATAVGWALALVASLGAQASAIGVRFALWRRS